MKLVKDTFWLPTGIGLIAVITGYMVGASQTPVVGIAMPAIFGLIVTAFGFFTNSELMKKIDTIKEAFNKNNVQEIQSKLEFLSSEAKGNPMRIGRLLVVFSLAYALGLSFGTYLRVTNPFASKQARQFPWSDNPGAIEPPSALDAIDWIQLQEALSDLGYTQQQVKSLYQLQTKEWNKEKADFGSTSFISKFKSFSQNEDSRHGASVPLPAPVEKKLQNVPVPLEAPSVRSDGKH
jgi:hypothetical protein